MKNKDIADIICSLLFIGYVIAGVYAFGHSYSRNEDCAKVERFRGDCKFGNSAEALVAAVAWPLYLSIELQEKGD